MQYIYELPNWPNFKWENNIIYKELAKVKYQQGLLLGRMENLGFNIQEDALLTILTNEVIKTSEIEGESLNSDEVRSSIARHLGMDIGALLPSDHHIDGIVEVILDATQNYIQPLTEQRLLHWHATLFPTGMSGMMLVNPGAWRTDSGGPMQVISGRYGREKIHFQAPPAKVLPKEINKFIDWFEQNHREIDPVIKAAIAHLWFVILHPFDDGNGRISRAITDMALARSENLGKRFYSMSTQIRKQPKSYYDILEQTQKNSLDITPWLIWFLDCLYQAIKNSNTLLENILNKAKFWEQNSEKAFNQRQITMLNTLFDGFKGKLTSIKWAKMTNSSQDTATRDINKLIEEGILVKSNERGRSTSYLLKDFPINFVS